FATTSPTTSSERPQLQASSNAATLKPLLVQAAMESNMQRAAVGAEHGFVHHFGERGMREDGGHEFGFGEFTGARDGVTLDQFGDFCTDHVGAKELAGL